MVLNELNSYSYIHNLNGLKTGKSLLPQQIIFNSVAIYIICACVIPYVIKWLTVITSSYMSLYIANINVDDLCDNLMHDTL